MVQTKLALVRDLLDVLDGLDEPIPVDRERIEQDAVVRLAVERVLTQLVELAASVNAHIAVVTLGRGVASYRESFLLAAHAGVLTTELATRLAPSAGLRNVLVHEYVAVDQQRVVQGVGRARVDFREYVREVAGFLRSRA